MLLLLFLFLLFLPLLLASLRLLLLLLSSPLGLLVFLPRLLASRWVLALQLRGGGVAPPSASRGSSFDFADTSGSLDSPNDAFLYRGFDD